MKKWLGIVGLVLIVLISPIVFLKPKTATPVFDQAKIFERAPIQREPESVEREFPHSPSAAAPTAAAASEKQPESPTGDARLDEAYRNNPEWRKRWDRYRRDFATSQMAHNQPPRPPDPPWVEEARLRSSDHSAPNPFGRK